MRITVGLPLLPSTPSFLPLIFFPQLGHDSSNSRNWSCNNLLSGIHRRSSPDQSVITLFLVLPSPGYLRDHRTRNPLLLSLSLPLSLSPFSHVENLTSVSKEEVVDVAQNVVFRNANGFIAFLSLLSIKNKKPWKTSREEMRRALFVRLHERREKTRCSNSSSFPSLPFFDGSRSSLFFSLFHRNGRS